MNDRLNFVKGVLIAIPISLALWAVIFSIGMTLYNLFTGAS